MATLLVAVVGATFAYFTATNDTKGSTESNANVTTKEVGGTTFTLTNDSTWTKNKLDYPGGIALLRAVANAKKSNGNDTNTYDFSYDLSLTGTSGITTALNWHLYELDQNAETTLSEVLGTKFGIDSCKLVSDTKTTGETRYYYTNDGQPYEEEIGTDKDCNATTLGISTQLSEYEIAGGTLTSGTWVDTVKSNKDMSHISSTLKDVSDSSSGVSKYYYLVLEYPNSNTDQKEDIGDTINVTFSLADDSVKVVAKNA